MCFRVVAPTHSACNSADTFNQPNVCVCKLDRHTSSQLMKYYSTLHKHTDSLYVNVCVRIREFEACAIYTMLQHGKCVFNHNEAGALKGNISPASLRVVNIARRANNYESYLSFSCELASVQLPGTQTHCTSCASMRARHAGFKRARSSVDDGTTSAHEALAYFKC